MCDPAGVLKELRASHGGPHLGSRLLALVLVLLLAFPLTYALWQLLAYLADHLI